MQAVEACHIKFLCWANCVLTKKDMTASVPLDARTAANFIPLRALKTMRRHTRPKVNPWKEGDYYQYSYLKDLSKIHD